MASVGIVGCLLTFLVLGRDALGTGAFGRFMVTLGVLTLGFGIAALIAETTWALLVPMLAGLVIIWAAALLHDAGYIAPAHAVRHAGRCQPGAAGHPSRRGLEVNQASRPRPGRVSSSTRRSTGGTLEAGSDERADGGQLDHPDRARSGRRRRRSRSGRCSSGAAGVSARRRHRSGTGTRVIAFAGFTASWAAGSAFDDCLDRAQVLLPAAPYQKTQER